MNPPPPPSDPDPGPSHQPPPYSQDGGSDLRDYSQAQTDAAATATAALSQEHTPPTPSASAGPSNGRKRRPPGAPGSRGVANLTPDQLAKKRANDREAQRAIRERTRNTIESLERRIRELESQQPFQELQRVVQERDRALQECDELRKRLAAVAGIVGGQNPSLIDLAVLTAQQSPLPQNPQQPQSYEQSQALHHIHPDLRSPSATTQGSPASHTSTAAAYQSGSGTLRRWSPSLDQLPTDDKYGGGTPYEQLKHRAPPAQMHGQPQNGERLGVDFLLEPKDQSNASPNTHSYQSPHAHDQTVPLYARLTNVGPSSCPLDSLLIDFLNSRRKMLREGVSVIGPEYPAFAAMLDPASHPRPHPVSSLLIDILSKFPDIGQLPEKVAVLYIMFLVMRWLICPCPETYDRLPEFCRPVQEQLELPHVAWADYLPWPHMRRQLCVDGTDIKFQDWFVPYTTTLSLNWDQPHERILIPQPQSDQSGSGQLTLNPVFEHYLRDLENWSLGNEFAKAFPRFVDHTTRIKSS